MPLKTRTQTQAVHRTTLTLDGPKIDDKGKSLLLQTHGLITSNSQVGVLTVTYGLGGSIRSITFEEKETIPQKDVEVDSEDISS
jgi:hypothetical protein